MNIKALIQHNRARRFRTQTGTIVERADGFHLRYYTDRNGQRVKVTERLCGLDASKSTIEQARRRRMKAINAEAHDEVAQPSGVLITEFWETYLAYVESTLRPSTVAGYKKIWKTHLKAHFTGRKLADYGRGDGFAFLVSLVPKLSANSLQHVRNLASGLFSHAVNLNLVEHNIWADVTSPKMREPEPTVAYTIEEMNAILKVISRSDAKLLFGLCGFMGVRPSEAAGLRWSDVDDDQIHIRRAVVSGVCGDLKTKRSKRDLRLIEPVKSLLNEWRTQSKGAGDAFLFTGRAGRPLNTSSFAKHCIKPDVEKAKLVFRGLYAARRACATNLVALTGNVNAAYQVLGNSMAVSMAKYVKPSVEAGDAGLQLLEQATQKGEATR